MYTMKGDTEESSDYSGHAKYRGGKKKEMFLDHTR